ncbi:MULTISPECIES: hypothetical protein [unclassified Agarivorans]|uniref:hypothetical protein n=1 Tax=unclassified Agarivorans TaxID=2636026 RepID=UPI0026E39E52|nr:MULTISPECIES: hypothetical protein [unclassified Agarivorans]MDO6686643.1 hypothetical protein [Agarivorans sp. 3_MG-2023]MDO6717740.1 hypothetical protein [Agarivorans sp. 2_MG-2023]
MKIGTWFVSKWKAIKVLFNIENLIRAVNILSVLFFTVYLYSMFILPFWDGNWSWRYVQKVWYSWQALNVGMLAFGSSIIAFNISRYHVAKQQEREFIASKAFLPQALSDLCEYLVSCAPILTEAYRASKDRKAKKKSLIEKVPSNSELYIPVFKECIKFSPPNVADYLAKILMLLQIHDARTKALSSEGPSNLGYQKSCLYSLAELKVRVNSLFDFARGEESFIPSSFTSVEFSSAFKELGLSDENLKDLIEYAKRKHGS